MFAHLKNGNYCVSLEFLKHVEDSSFQQLHRECTTVAKHSMLQCKDKHLAVLILG